MGCTTTRQCLAWSQHYYAEAWRAYRRDDIASELWRVEVILPQETQTRCYVCRCEGQRYFFFYKLREARRNLAFDALFAYDMAYPEVPVSQLMLQRPLYCPRRPGADCGVEQCDVSLCNACNHEVVAAFISWRLCAVAPALQHCRDTTQRIGAFLLALLTRREFLLLEPDERVAWLETQHSNRRVRRVRHVQQDALVPLVALDYEVL